MIPKETQNKMYTLKNIDFLHEISWTDGKISLSCNSYFCIFTSTKKKDQDQTNYLVKQRGINKYIFIYLSSST